MYKTSTDLRFVKNRDVLQRAFIDLTLEKQTTRISVKEIIERAQVNRMTFYSHYDEVPDILLEFVDGLTSQLIEAHRIKRAQLDTGAYSSTDEHQRTDGCQLASADYLADTLQSAGTPRSANGLQPADAVQTPITPDIKQLLLDATALMEEELEFYRLVAQDQHFELYRAQFRKAFTAIFSEELEHSSGLEETEREMMAGMVASGVTYAYLDWLANKYDDLPLDDLLRFCERFITCTLYGVRD